MILPRDGSASYRSMVLRASNTLTYYASSKAYASCVNDLLHQSGHEDTWQSITVTRPTGSEGFSVIRVTIDSLAT